MRAVVVTGLSIGLTDMVIPVTWPRDDALLLPIDYASSVGADLADSGVLAADDPHTHTHTHPGETA